MTTLLPRQKLLRRALLAGGGALALPALMLLAGYLFADRVVTVVDEPAPANVIVLLGGTSEERVQLAIYCFQDNLAPKIITTGRGDNAANVTALTAAGVPLEAILVEDRSASTLENARFTALLLQRMGARRAILVTSWFHSRRALSCFRHFAPTVKFISLHSPRQPALEDYNTRWARQEYVKLLSYWICYGVAPY